MGCLNLYWLSTSVQGTPIQAEIPWSQLGPPGLVNPLAGRPQGWGPPTVAPLPLLNSLLLNLP